MQEKTLVAHMCERKRRALQRDEKRVQAGYMAFNRWWQLAQGYTKQKTYDEFCDTAYYNAFVKFGSFLNNVSPIYPEKLDRKSTRLNSSHIPLSRMPSSA